MDLNMRLMERFGILEWLINEHRRFHLKKTEPIRNRYKGQGRILWILSVENGLSTKELSYRTGTKISSLNETLSRMEREGYVKREPLKEDRRVIINSLTEKGREMIPDLEIDSPFSSLTTQEKNELLSLIDKVNDNLYSELVLNGPEELKEKISLRKQILSEFERKCAFNRKEEKIDKNDQPVS